MLTLLVPIDPPPGRVCDVEAENYGQILWHKEGREWMSPEPNPCPFGEVGDRVIINRKKYLISSIDVIGGPQICADELPWEWKISLEEVQHG